MSETIVLDATGIAVNRTQLDITSWVAAAGPDWGDAAIQAYMATAAVGEVRLHYRLPNRQIKIPLTLKAVGATSFATIRSQVQAKVGLLQREGGWIMRQVGATPLYADIQSATLHLGGSMMQAYLGYDVDAVLSLECLPDWYGDEVTLSTHTETTLPHLFFTEATINGNYPGRARIVATNGTTVDQHGLLWGIRSRTYNAGTTTAMFYEAEALTPVNGAAGTALAGASGGSAVTISTIPSGRWVSMLNTNMVSGTTSLTHVGSYRVWARAYSATGVPQLRFQWGAGGLSSPIVNNPVVLPGTAAFYMVDLGSMRLDAPPIMPNQWLGVVQANVSVGNTPVAIDCLYFQPLDEGAGKLIYAPPSSPASSIADGGSPGTAVDATGVGTVAWINSVNALVRDNFSTFASLSSGSPKSHYLKAAAFGFNIPAGATIVGIQATVAHGAGTSGILDNQISLVKAGTVQSTDKSSASLWPGGGGSVSVLATYGSNTDLWGTTWTPTDINNSGFGLAVSAQWQSGGPNTAYVDWVGIAIWYTLASGFTVAPDAVIAASGTAELRTDGMYRQSTGGTIYAPVSTVIGDLPRVPPSGLEGRTLQVFLKQTRGNFANEPDSAIDDMSAAIKYRPSFLLTP